MTYFLYLKDNGNNDDAECVIKLKAKTLAAAKIEAHKEVLDLRFGEDREGDGPDDDPKAIFTRSGSFCLESATIFKVADETEIDIDGVCDNWEKSWRKRNK